MDVITTLNIPDVASQMDSVRQIAKTTILETAPVDAPLIAFDGPLTVDSERFFELKRIKREEEPRRVSLEVTEEELVIFDILTRPAPALNAATRAEVKKVARDLLNRLKHCWCSTGGRNPLLARSSSSPLRTCSTRFPQPAESRRLPTRLVA